MYSQHPELAKEFEAATPKGKHLPEHVPQKMAEGGLVDILRHFMVGDKAEGAVKHDVSEAAAADAIDPVVTASSDTAKGYSKGGEAEFEDPVPGPSERIGIYEGKDGKQHAEQVMTAAEGGMTDKDEPGLQDATTTDFLLPFMLGRSSNIAEELGPKLADEAGSLTLGKAAPAMEEAANQNEVTAFVKGIQKGAPGTEGVKIYGVKGSPEKLKELFGDEAPGSVPEHILREKGILPAKSVSIPTQQAPNAYAEGGKVERSSLEHPVPNGMMARAMADGGYANGGYPHVAFLENETPEKVKKDTHMEGKEAGPMDATETGEKKNPPHMADGGAIHKAEDRNKEPARPKDIEMSHEEKLKSIYKAMGIKKYADGGVTTNDGTVDVSQLPGATPSPTDPGFWDTIKAALAKVGAPIEGAANMLAKPAEAMQPIAAAAAPAVAGAINKLTGSDLPVPAAPAAPAPSTTPAALPVVPPATPPMANKVPMAATGPISSPPPDLKGLFNQDTSKLTAGVNPEDRQALVAKMQGQQHGIGSVIAEAISGLGDALAAKGGKDQHSLQNIFSMQKEQRAEALANFDQARQDRLQKLDLQTKMGQNALQGLAAQDAYGTDEHLNKMLGAPPGTAHKDLPLYFQAKAASVAQQEKDADLYMKAHSQASTDVDSAVKNASVLGVKPSAAQLQASGQKLADNYYNRAKGNILVKPSDGGAAQWIPASNIGKAKQMDPNLSIIPG